LAIEKDILEELKLSNVYESIACIIEDVADIPKDEIEESSSFMDDLDLASLEIMSIVAKIEKEFSITISSEDLLSIETINDMMGLISVKMN
jgi:acyl carrier protein